MSEMIAVVTAALIVGGFVAYTGAVIAAAIIRLADAVRVLNTHGLHLRTVPGYTVEVTLKEPHP